MKRSFEQSEGLVLVHGAWHGGWCWENVAPLLRDKGYVVETPTINTQDSRSDFRSFADQITLLVSELRQERLNVTLVGHSRAANTITHLAKIRPIKQLIFIAGSFQEETVACLKSANIEIPEKTLDNGYRKEIEEKGMGDMLTQIDPEHAMDYLFHDAQDKHQARKDAERLTYQREPSNATPIERWPYSPSAHIVCTKDKVVNPEYCRAMAKIIGGPVIELVSGHAPYYSMPEQLAAGIDGLANQVP